MVAALIGTTPLARSYCSKYAVGARIRLYSLWLPGPDSWFKQKQYLMNLTRLTSQYLENKKSDTLRASTVHEGRIPHV